MRCHLVQVSEVTDKNPLELLPVLSAVPWTELALIRLDQDPLAVRKGLDGRAGNDYGLVDVDSVAGEAMQLSKPTQHDALVVTPRLKVVIPALAVQTVVDEMIWVDHAASLEPIPLIDGDALQGLVMRHAAGQRGSHRQVQLVGDGTDVLAIFVPVYAPLARCASSCLHIMEDIHSSVDVVSFARDVKGVDET